MSDAGDPVRAETGGDMTPFRTTQTFGNASASSKTRLDKPPYRPNPRLVRAPPRRRPGGSGSDRPAAICGFRRDPSVLRPLLENEREEWHEHGSGHYQADSVVEGNRQRTNGSLGGRHGSAGPWTRSI